jgi:hypothetical protein
MAKKHRKKCSPSLAIDSTSPLSEWLASRTPPTTNVGKVVGEKETFIYCWWECKQYGGSLKN